MHRLIASTLLLTVGVVDLAWINLSLVPTHLTSASVTKAHAEHAALGRGEGQAPEHEPDRVSAEDRVTQRVSPEVDRATVRVDDPTVSVRVAETEETLVEQIYFARPGSATLSRPARTALRGLALRLRDDPTLVNVVRGFSDSRGDDERNLALSKQRALAAREVLLRNGVSEGRVVVESAGARSPVFDGRGRELLRLERRVDLLLMRVK